MFSYTLEEKNEYRYLTNTTIIDNSFDRKKPESKIQYLHVNYKHLEYFR